MYGTRTDSYELKVSFSGNNLKLDLWHVPSVCVVLIVTRAVRIALNHWDTNIENIETTFQYIVVRQIPSLVWCRHWALSHSLYHCLCIIFITWHLFHWKLIPKKLILFCLTIKNYNLSSKEYYLIAFQVQPTTLVIGSEPNICFVVLMSYLKYFNRTWRQTTAYTHRETWNSDPNAMQISIHWLTWN